jgi:SNF2 family DNA or RNA helicase
MIVVTHQTLRDDLIHAMAAHRGEDPTKTAEWFNSQPEHTQRQAVKSAMEHHGWGADFLAVDEAHQLLNRQGKENSSMANAIDGMSYHMPHYLSMTGTPVKNDASEAFDFLRKLDPQRFHDQGDFMRRYGVDTEASKASLQRLMARYVYQERIPSGVNRTMEVRDVPLTEKQQQAYDGLEAAYRRARRADRKGEVDLDAVKELAPHRFEGQPAEKHDAIARSVLAAGLGGALQNRRRQIVNEFDFDHNAKIQALREDLVKDRDKPHVIFAHNYGSISNIKRLCAELGMSVGVLNGRQSALEKMNTRLGFNPEGDAKPKYDVLINTDAGAVGQNLQRGTVLSNYDTPDTAMLHEQRIARIDRIGQRNDVTVRDYTTKTKYERTARRRLAKKYALSDVFQSPSHNLDDTGLAAEIQRVRAAKGDKGPILPERPPTAPETPGKAPLPAANGAKPRGGVRQQQNLDALKEKWAQKEKTNAGA